MKNKEELENFMLIPTYNAPRIQDTEFILIMTKGEIRKPVLLTYPKNRFDRMLRYVKKQQINWN